MNATRRLARDPAPRPSPPGRLRGTCATAAAYVRRHLPAGAQTDRGAMSLLFATVAVALALFTCFVADAGRAMHADSRADDLAQEAARAAGQQLDPAQAISGTAFVVDPDTARTAALDYLAARGMTGTVTVTNGGTTIEVTATSRYHTLFLGVLGTPTLPVTGHGTARLVTHEGAELRIRPLMSAVPRPARSLASTPTGQFQAGSSRSAIGARRGSCAAEHHRSALPAPAVAVRPLRGCGRAAPVCGVHGAHRLRRRPGLHLPAPARAGQPRQNPALGARTFPLAALVLPCHSPAVDRAVPAAANARPADALARPASPDPSAADSSWNAWRQPTPDDPTRSR